LAFAGEVLVGVLHDAAKSLWRTPSFTIAAMLTFTLGIGMNIAVFSVVDRMLFRPLPYAHRDRLVQIHLGTAKGSRPYALMPRAITCEIAAHSQSIDSIAFAGLGSSAEDGSVQIALGTWNLLSTIGVRPILGRDFTLDDVRAKEPLALLTFDTWHRRFGGAATVIDSRQRLADREYRIVGVLPDGFLLPSTNYVERLGALTLDFDDFQPRPMDKQGFVTYAPVARMRPGYRVADVEAELRLLTLRVRKGNPMLEAMISDSGAGSPCSLCSRDWCSCSDPTSGSSPPQCGSSCSWPVPTSRSSSCRARARAITKRRFELPWALRRDACSWPCSPRQRCSASGAPPSLSSFAIWRKARSWPSCRRTFTDSQCRHSTLGW
jgi:hypothetical protein